MKQTLWGAVALSGCVAVVAVALYVTSPPGQLAVAVVDAVIAAVALLVAVVGAVLLSGPAPELEPVGDRAVQPDPPAWQEDDSVVLLGSARIVP